MTRLLIGAFLVLAGALQAQDGGDRSEAEKIKLRRQEIDAQLQGAKERGDKEFFNSLMKEAAGLKERLKELSSRREGDQGEDALIDRIGKVRKEALRAKRDGQFENAKELWTEAERLGEKLSASFGGRSPKEDKVDPALAKIKASAQAQAKATRGKADELRAEALGFREKSEALAQEGRKDEAEKLRHHAEDLAAKAKALAQEAKEQAASALKKLEGAAVPKGKGQSRPPKKPQQPERSAAAQTEVGRQVEELRNEVRELRELLKKSLHGRAEGEKEKSFL